MVTHTHTCGDKYDDTLHHPIPAVSDKEAGGFSVSWPKPGPTGLKTQEGLVFGAVNNMADCGPSVELVPTLKE